MQFNNIEGKLKNDTKTVYRRKQLTGFDKPSYITSYSQGASEILCTVCSCDDKHVHGLWKRVKFYELSMRDKRSVVKKSRCCYKCLNFGHVHAECKSKYCCQMCQSDHHHYLLCMNDKLSCNNDTKKSIARSVDAEIYNALLNKKNSSYYSCQCTVCCLQQNSESKLSA